MHAARREDGAVIVEFALVLPVLLLVLFGFLYIGLATNAKIDSTHLTAEGARYIAVNQNPGLPSQTLQAYIRSRADSSALRTGATVCIDYPVNTATSTSGKVGDPVHVRLTYSAPLIPLISSHLAGRPATIPVSSEATMRLEALPTKVPAGCT